MDPKNASIAQDQIASNGNLRLRGPIRIPNNHTTVRPFDPHITTGRKKRRRTRPAKPKHQRAS